MFAQFVKAHDGSNTHVLTHFIKRTLVFVISHYVCGQPRDLCHILNRFLQVRRSFGEILLMNPKPNQKALRPLSLSSQGDQLAVHRHLARPFESSGQDNAILPG